MACFDFFKKNKVLKDETSIMKEPEVDNEVLQNPVAEESSWGDWYETEEQPVEEPVRKLVPEEETGESAEESSWGDWYETEDTSGNELKEDIKAIKDELKALESLKKEMEIYKADTMQVLMSLDQALMEKFTLIDKQEEIIKRQSQTIARFQDDLLYKIQKPLIMEMIEIADNIRLILNDRELAESEDFASLMGRVRGLADWVNASLSNNSVKAYSLAAECPASIDRKKQEVIDVEDTDNPAMDSTYYTERPGYIWSMPYLIINSDIQLKKALEDAPKAFEFIIRPEEIVKYKYRNAKENKE